MAATDRAPPSPTALERQFWVGVARAFGGAILFSLPMFMTMEMWWLGFTMERERLALMLFLGIPLLVGLSHYIGFEATFGWLDDVVDAFVAYAVGFVAGGSVLLLFGVIEPGMAVDEIVGKVALQALAGAIGAMLAQNQFGQSTHSPSAERNVASYRGELFVMAVGSLFLAFNVAPTEEMVLIAYRMTEWHAVALAALSLLLMHAFVYAVRFTGEERRLPEKTPAWSLFLRYTVAGYAVALAMSVYALWSFGRLDGLALEPAAMATVVLAFPSAMGAAAARLIL
ncbi:TIGR02587 family membrane protein [Azospirillum sp. ST 5-10]|uniref:TIGR02587 family membrane protein n=1 Tax=unclassified Azospirillum TaxID=2630922 RepID=UPI003F4A2B2D